MSLDDDDDEAEQGALNAVADAGAAKLSAVLRSQLAGLAQPSPAVAVGLMQNFDHGEELRLALFQQLVAGADAGAGVAQQTLQRVGAGIDLTLVSEQAQQWARAYSYDLVRGINATTRQTLQTAIGDWIGQGQPLSDLVAQVQPAFGANRARAIAFTETTRAFAEGSILSYEQSGVVQGVEWQTARDERTCRVCGGYHGKEFPLRSQIRPPAHVGCRCWLIPTILEETAKPKTPAKPAPKPKPPKVDPLFPVDPNGLEVVRKLGGSTGAELVRDPATQALYVRKRGANADHLREEAHADTAYQALGVKVPPFRLYETGGGPVKLAQYIDGQSLGSLRTSDPALYQKAAARLRKDFAADAILGNWDVVGLNADNVLVDKKGQPWRIDNGGSLRRRAQGALKRPEDWNQHVGELWTLRNPQLNAQTATVFGEMSYGDVLDSVETLVRKEKALLKALPAELQDTVKARITSARDLLKTGRTLQADQWADQYNDDFGRHLVGLRKAGVPERFPTRLDHSGVEIFDQAGKPFDDLRGAQSIMYEVEKYVKAQGGSMAPIYDWMNAQASTSWSPQSQAYKYFLAQNRGQSADYFWLDGHDPTGRLVEGLPGAIKSSQKNYNAAVGRWGDSSYRESFTAWHAFNYEFVRSVPFENNNLKKGVITLMRTESETVINRYLKLGETGQMLRGAAESTSIYKPVTVAGQELTMQQVPHHRILGSYFFERGAGTRISPFLGDGENEFVSLLAGLNVKYERSLN